MSNNIPIINSIVFFPTTETELITAFIYMKNTKSRDRDDLNIKPVKCVIDIIALVQHIYNLVLEWIVTHSNADC